MTMIWASGPADSTDKLVLLALADYANDAFECWPSVDALAAKCSLSDRGTQKALRRLEAAGWLSVAVGGGRKACSRYTVNPEPRSPINEVKEGTSFTDFGAKRVNVVPEKGERGSEKGERGSPEPSRTVIEPSAAAARASEEGSLSYRERVIRACGFDDLKSTVTVTGSFLGNPTDMLAANRWIAPKPDGLGMTADQVVAVIADRMRSGRPPPRRLSYFDGAMADFAAARDRPIQSGTPPTQRTDPTVDRWNRLAGAKK